MTPVEVLESELRSLANAASVVADTEMAEMSGDERRKVRSHLHSLHTSVDTLNRAVSKLDAMATGTEPATCGDCGERFYPLRGDARYCGSTCRSRAHRAGKRSAQATSSSAGGS